MPSPFTSAAATDTVPLPTPGEDDTTKPPLPLFVNTVSEPKNSFALIKSTLPSPFTSAATTKKGSLPTPGEEDITKLP